MNRRRLAAQLQLLLLVLLAIGVSAGAATLPPEGEWTANGAIERSIADEVRASKPRNVWTVEGLRSAGFAGCVPVDGDVVTFEHLPAAHVVRLPLAEGWRWVRMPAREVAARLEVFGGTTSTRDDVVVVGNCYR